MIDIKADGNTAIDTLNGLIEKMSLSGSIHPNDVSDGYHTFGELYDHRVILFLALGRIISITPAFINMPVWKSKVHSDGSWDDAWFVMGIKTEAGEQITYHLPINKWDDAWFASELPKAPYFDGHTSADVLHRLATLI